ncbi:MAG: hypothetical protein J5570_04590 [Lachnospiraceae bacterium]|nr:hypothetical protein [Lachnospiraceae bacterium]
MSKKKTLFLSLSVLDVVFRVALWVIIIYFVIKGATKCYNLGYRVFTEEPIASEGYGKEVVVEIPVDFNAKELGELFESKGLSRDSILFALQYYASEYREGVKGGTYTLSTEMTAEEMFERISAENEAKEIEEEEPEILEDAEALTESEAEALEDAGDITETETVNP